MFVFQIFIILLCRDVDCMDIVLVKLKKLKEGIQHFKFLNGLHVTQGESRSYFNLPLSIFIQCPGMTYFARTQDLM